MGERIHELWEGQPSVVQLLAVAAAALALHTLTFLALRMAARRPGRRALHVVAGRLAGPSRLLLPLLALHLAAAPALHQRPTVALLAWPLLIAALAWTSMRLVLVIEDLLLIRTLSAQPGVEARKLRTQVSVLRRVLNFMIAVVAIGAILMSIERLRQLGTGLLASAGIAGLVIGFSAQKTLGNLLAGIQIAIAQPIRVGDAVVVEGEWGHIEDITLTYVVLRVWDLRRLILPISYFIEKPFQNWTVTSEEVLGAVVIHADYRVPVENVRAELTRLVEASPLWDRKVQNLQVTEVTDRTVLLRALVSAADSGKCWELRCFVREQLIKFLRDHHPDCLPRTRGELDALPAGATLGNGHAPGRDGQREDPDESAIAPMGHASPTT